MVLRTKPVEKRGAMATGFRLRSLSPGQMYGEAIRVNRVLYAGVLLSYGLLAAVGCARFFVRRHKPLRHPRLPSRFLPIRLPPLERLRRRPLLRVTQFRRSTPFSRGKVCRFEASRSRASRQTNSQPLAGHLPTAEGAPLTEVDLKRSLRQLYATGLYDTIEARATRAGNGVVLIFAGLPRTFIGTVSVDGAAGATMNMQLERSSQLDAWHTADPEKLQRAVAQMRSTLEQNGYYESAIQQTITPRPRQQLADIAFHVVSGPRAHVGKVTVTGDSGMTVEEFRRHARSLEDRARRSRHGESRARWRVARLPEAGPPRSRSESSNRPTTIAPRKRSIIVFPPIAVRSCASRCTAPASIPTA